MPRQREAAVLEALAVAVVELVAVAVALAHDRLAVGLVHLRPRCQHGVVGPEPHGATHVDDVALGVHQVDDRVGAGGVELGGVGPGQAEHVAGELDRHHVQPEAQPEARDAALPGVGGRRDLPLDPPHPEAPRDHHAVEVGQATLGQEPFDLLGLHPVDLDAGAVVVARVAEALDDRQVGVGKVDVLADQPDPHGPLGVVHPVDQRLPGSTGRARRRGRGCGRSRRRSPRRAARAAARRCWRRRRRSPRPARRRRRGWRSCSSTPTESGRSLRHTITSGWMPRLRSSVTECCVGLVFCSPEGPMNGTRVTWT